MLSSTLYLTVYSYPPPLLRTCNWLFFTMCNHFLSSSVSCTYLFPYVSLLGSFWMLTLSCSTVIPRSLHSPQDLLSEFFSVGAEQGVRLFKAQDHEGSRERELNHWEGLPLVLCALSLGSSMSWGRAVLAPPQPSAFPGPLLCALLSSALLSPAPAGQAFKVLCQPEVIFDSY